jgi:hypothetical protein
MDGHFIDNGINVYLAWYLFRRTLKKAANIHGAMEFQSHHDSSSNAGKAWTV